MFLGFSGNFNPGNPEKASQSYTERIVCSVGKRARTCYVTKFEDKLQRSVFVGDSAQAFLD